MGHNGAAITGCGAAFPGRRITNHDLEKMIDTSNKWILDRTGIRERRILEEGLSTVDLSERAARDALEGAGINRPHRRQAGRGTQAPNQAVLLKFIKHSFTTAV